MTKMEFCQTSRSVPAVCNESSCHCSAICVMVCSEVKQPTDDKYCYVFKFTSLGLNSPSFDKPFPFLLLPGELRNIVYNHVMTGDGSTVEVKTPIRRYQLGLASKYYFPLETGVESSHCSKHAVVSNPTTTPRNHQCDES